MQAACDFNIGRQERRKRLTAGAVFGGITLLMAAAMVVEGVGRGWRLTLVLPALLATVGYFQAADGT